LRQTTRARVGSGRVGSGRVGSGRVGSGKKPTAIFAHSSILKWALKN
jgi:hypothetical protein